MTNYKTQIETIERVAKELGKALAPTDTIYIDRLVVYYEARHKAMRDFIKEKSAFDYSYYKELHAVSGGVTLYNQLQYEPAPYNATQDKNSPEYDPTKPLFGYDENGRNPRVKELAIKNAKKTLKARDAKLGVKLEKIGVTKIVDSKVNYTTDGFHGSYKVGTNSGDKKIVLQTIVAGGYNIQCAHYRTLINIVK
tara:strand:+ start:67 stop:651 length:585 start_codon:yes stop_codon:yes gene_type:complete